LALELMCLAVGQCYDCKLQIVQRLTGKHMVQEIGGFAMLMYVRQID